MSDVLDHHDFQDKPDFGLPGGYFQRSAASVMNKIEWIEEHRPYAKLSALKDNSGFSVPGGYFDKLELRTELIELPMLGRFVKKNVFSTPPGYFEDLEVLELSNVIGEGEFKPLFPGSQGSFTVKKDYFAYKEKQLRQLLAADKKPARLIVLFGQKAWLAAAAILLLAIGFWAYSLYVQPLPVNDCGTMACVDKNEVLRSKSLETIDTDELYELIDTKKLEKKLDQKSGGTTENKKSDSLLDAAEDYLLEEI